MKYLILLTLLLAPVAASAQGFTPVPQDKANVYYQSCASQPSQFSSQESQNIFCACTAARMTQFYSMEDMKNATSQDPAIARPAYNKMLIDVYAPCMDTPTFEYYHKTCITNPDTAKYGDPQKICNCLAEQMAIHMRGSGPQIFRDILARDPNILDPQAALFSDPAFNTFAQKKLLTCVR